MPNPSIVPPNFVLSAGPWIAELESPSANWAVRGVSTTKPTAPILQLVTVGTVGTITTTINHGILLGERFRISRVEPVAERCLNGIYVATAVPTLDTIQFTVPTGTNVTLGPGGTIRGQLPAYEKITSVSLAKIVSRRTGRPFDLPRGRSSRRIRCCP